MNLITLENTRFIFDTNFSGDPARDRFGDDRRKVNIIIPSIEQAIDLRAAGFKVHELRPRPTDDPAAFVPVFWVTPIVQYRRRDRSLIKWPPKVYLVADMNTQPVLMTEDTVGSLDFIRVRNVNTVLAPYQYEANGGGWGLRVRTMYVEQDLSDDPFAERYAVNDIPPEPMPEW